jgi:hypothetical protein
MSLIWGCAQLSRNLAADEYRDIESDLLRFEMFSPVVSTGLLTQTSTHNLTACDLHGQRALLLLEMPLAETALRTGAAGDFDRHIKLIESRARETLACAPRDSLVWLILFAVEVLHGRLGPQTFDLLTMSYSTSPNEAWVSLRRIIGAIPVALSAPEPVRERILADFSSLIRNGYLDIPATVYLRSSTPVRTLLQAEIEKLPSYNRKKFMDALDKARSRGFVPSRDRD